MKNFKFEDLEQIARSFIPEPTGHDLLDQRYNWQKNENGAEWPYYRFFYHLAQIYSPRLVVELGSYQGTAAAHFAGGMSITKGVIPAIVTIDHHSDPGDESNQFKILQAQEEFPNLIYYYQGWTTPELAEAQKGQHFRGDIDDAYHRVVEFIKRSGNGIDILFIDSWHCYKYAMMDWNAYSPLLNKPALVICDDIQGGGGEFDPIQGMLDFWNELPAPKFLNANLHPGTNMGFVKYE